MGGWMPNWLEIAGKHFFLTWVAQFAHKLLFVGVHKHKQVWNLISVSALPELCELCDPSKFSFLGAHSPALAEFLVLPAFCFICTTQNPWYAWQAQNPPTHPQTHKPDIHYFSPASPCISLMNFFAFTCLGSAEEATWRQMTRLRKSSIQSWHSMVGRRKTLRGRC